MSNNEPAPTFVVSNKAYDLMRFVALILLPGLAAAYYGLSQPAVLDLPGGERVIGVIAVVDTFLGLILASLKRAYDKSPDGTLVIEPNEEGDADNLNLSLNPESLVKKDRVVVEVKRAR